MYKNELTKLLVMYHYLNCKLTFDLQINNKLHKLNIDYYNSNFKISLKFILKLKFYNYMQKKLHHT